MKIPVFCSTAPVSSGSSSTTDLSSMGRDELDQDNVLRKIVDEETPLISKDSYARQLGSGRTSKFLMGLSEREFWIIFTGILIVNFVSVLSIGLADI